MIMSLDEGDHMDIKDVQVLLKEGFEDDLGSMQVDKLSRFPLQVVVPTVDKAAMSLVKVGMTCKVRLDLKSPAAMMLPIAAVKFDGSTATVKQLTDDGHSKIVMGDHYLYYLIGQIYKCFLV